jgi:hypothetical protein
MGGMEKTTVYLTSEQKVALARAAAAEGTSEARLIRAGIDAVTAPHRAGEARPALAEGGRGVLDVASSPGGLPGSPSPARPRWTERDAFVRLVLRHPADTGLRAELRELAPGTTDDELLA